MKNIYPQLCFLLFSFLFTSCSKNEENGTSSDSGAAYISGNFSFNDGHGTLCSRLDVQNIVAIRTDSEGKQVAKNWLDCTYGSIPYGLICQNGTYVTSDRHWRRVAWIVTCY